jgi:tRNA pseudouridine55 synthase
MNDFLAGEVLLIDKPLQWTSFDVVKKIKYLLKSKLGIKKIKVGHAGTLDPLASGLLIVCTGKMTKQIPEIQDQKKEYTGIIELGAVTASYDLESEVEPKADPSNLSENDLLSAAQKLSGTIQQLPPIFSAKKIDGKRAYTLARKGEKPQMKSKQVEIETFELTQVELPEVHFRICCSKGTYIRSMAHDFGEILGVGGYLKALRRTAIGEYTVDRAMSIDVFQAQVEQLSPQQDS